jgi:hypothetical protein
MMQIYLHQAFNLFEFSMNAPDADEKLKPQRWLRRGALEAMFRLLEIARTCSHDPKELLESAIQPLFNSNLFKWLADKLTAKIGVEDNLLTKDIFLYLSGDLVLSAVKTYISIVENMF